MIDFSRSASVLQVRDVVRSRDFYCNELGFTSDSLWGEPPCFGIVGRGTITLFLDQTIDYGDRSIPLNQYWAVYCYVSDVDALAAEFTERHVEIMRGPVDAPHGCREIDVRDPDGHIICFGQDLQPGPDGPGL